MTILAETLICFVEPTEGHHSGKKLFVGYATCRIHEPLEIKMLKPDPTSKDNRNPDRTGLTKSATRLVKYKEGDKEIPFALGPQTMPPGPDSRPGPTLGL